MQLGLYDHHAGAKHFLLLGRLAFVYKSTRRKGYKWHGYLGGKEEGHVYFYVSEELRLLFSVLSS